MDEDLDNLECLRCGYQWYSKRYKQTGELPGECPRCFRDDIRPIPSPPSYLEKRERVLKEKLNNIPSAVNEKSYHARIWFENHRSEIGLVATGSIMLAGVLALSYAMFFV